MIGGSYLVQWGGRVNFVKFPSPPEVTGVSYIATIAFVAGWYGKFPSPLEVNGVSNELSKLMLSTNSQGFRPLSRRLGFLTHCT